MSERMSFRLAVWALAALLFGAFAAAGSTTAGLAVSVPIVAVSYLATRDQ